MQERLLDMFKSSIRSALHKMGLRLIRINHTFGLNPLIDIKLYYPDRTIATVVDVGANVGSFTREAAKNYPSAKVHAFEPIRSTYEELRRNTANFTNVVTHQLAIGNKHGKQLVYLQNCSEWNSIADAVNRPRGGAVTETVQVNTLNQLAVEIGFTEISLLKTDTEGYDIKVLSGASELLRSGVIGFVLSEAVFDRADTGHTNFFDLYDLLLPFGFHVFAVYDQTILPEQRHAGYCNVMFANNKHSII